MNSRKSKPMIMNGEVDDVAVKETRSAILTSNSVPNQ